MKPDPDRENMDHDPQLAALYRAAADAAPPGHLDDAIRAAARREAAAGPRRAGVRRWALPVSLAAVLVLSVSVVTLMREQGADRPESMIAPSPEAATLSAELAEPQFPAGPAPQAQLKRRPAAPVADMAPAAPAVRPEVPPAAPAASGDLAEAERSAATSTAKSKAAESSSRVEESPAGRRDYASPQQRSASPAPADAAGGASATGSAKPAAPAAAMSAAPARAALWQDLVREPPEKWLQRIAELRRAGQTADADTLLTEFRRRFPDAKLPEELR